MHLYASRLAINLGYVLELGQVKIAIEFPIDSSEQVEIEGRCHADFIVVGFQQLLVRLLQICAQKKGVSGLKNAANFRQKFYSRSAIKIANRAPEKQDEETLIALPVCSDLQQAIKILA